MDISAFLSFDKLMGQGLVKIVYFLGMIGIAFGCVSFIFAGFGFGGFGGGIGALIGAAIFGVIALCFLRFGCELYIVLFRMGEDLAAIRAGGKMPSAAPTVPTP
ncbi:MAG TPA: DUF4282 domain-containing protein [Hyphomonadaceae bacterium]|nr:DUF4282 domain-containing protein [Hyphomonadaceae bacterium]